MILLGNPYTIKDGVVHSPVIHDADTKFTAQFDEIFKAEGIRVKGLLPRCPNMAAYVERFIQTIQPECLDHFVVLGEKHLNDSAYPRTSFPT